MNLIYHTITKRHNIPKARFSLSRIALEHGSTASLRRLYTEAQVHSVASRCHEGTIPQPSETHVCFLDVNLHRKLYLTTTKIQYENKSNIKVGRFLFICVDSKRSQNYKCYAESY